MNLNSDNRPIALITGASGGIGSAIAKAFAEAGYDLILTCRSSMDALTALADRLAALHNISCQAVQADVGDYASVCKLFEGIDRLDVLVNNAGISYVGLLSDMEPSDWQKVMHVNLDSCFYTAKLSIPLFLKSHSGRIINISSVWGNVGASMEVAYSASKGGINSFTRALAKELAPSNIQVNALACGLIDTPMNAHLTEEDLQVLCEEIPADRMGRPEEAAAMVLQLAQAPEYLTGQIITMDGGWC